MDLLFPIRFESFSCSVVRMVAHTRVFESLILLMATGQFFFYARKHHSNTHSRMLYRAICVLQH